MREPVVFYYWRVDTGNGATPAERRRIVNEVVAPIYADPVIRADADCIYARKHTRAPVPGVLPVEPYDEVRLNLASTAQARVIMVPRVESRLPPDVHARIADDPATTRACGDDCSWYRHCLTDVTGIALDLHRSAELDAHREFLREIHARGGLRAFTREALHDYLALHSPTYAALRESRKGDFWHDFLRWGPEPVLFPPGHVLENLILVE